MSRKTALSDGKRYEVSYGDDHATGWWICVSDLESDEGDIVLDRMECGPFAELGTKGDPRDELISDALSYGVTITRADLDRLEDPRGRELAAKKSKGGPG